MKIAFTSCSRFESFPVQPEWDFIFHQQPDYLFLLGDNIYMDWFGNIGEPGKYPLDKFKKEMARKYENQWNELHFKNLRQAMQAKGGFFGTWDDHDFLCNNAKGAEWDSGERKAKKEFSRAQFHHYFDNCSTNPPETYYAIDTPKARVIFLDNRYYAQKPGENKQLLGEAQFQYLAEKLDHDLRYTIVCGGLTLTQGGENWKLYPKELQRLSKLLAAKQNVLFLAGDIHRNAFIKPQKLKTGYFTPLQIISSGMQIRLFGEKHNWCLLDFKDAGLELKFFQRNSVERKLTEECNEWLGKFGY